MKWLGCILGVAFAIGLRLFGWYGFNIALPSVCFDPFIGLALLLLGFFEIGIGTLMTGGKHEDWGKASQFAIAMSVSAVLATLTIEARTWGPIIFLSILGFSALILIFITENHQHTLQPR